MDIGNIWNSLYTSQLTGTQMYGLQSDPFQTYGSYADAWQSSPWQYGLQTGTVYGDAIQTWQNAGFMETLNSALTRYMETAPKSTDVERITNALEEANGNADEKVDVSTHEGRVVALGYDKALVYLPEEQKLMIVSTSGNSQNIDAKDSGSSKVVSTNTARAKAASADERGILTDQRRARASAAYRRTQTAKQRERTAIFLKDTQ